MGFVKLDSGLLTSTLWAHREEREVFITALLMAEPRELQRDEPTLEVDAIRETGFVVPPGWYGFVPAAGPGILRLALVDFNIGMEALRSLGNPDPESRSQEFEGRRMVRINGGYIILNFIKYRDYDHSSADRSRRYRLRQKGEPSRRDATVERCVVTQAEAEYRVQEVPPTVVVPAAIPMGKPDKSSPRDEILLHWRAVAVPAGLPDVLKLSDKLCKAMDVRLRDSGWLSLFREAVVYAALSPDGAWMRGGGDRRWLVTLDWLLKPDKAEQIAAKARASPGRAAPLKPRPGAIAADAATQAQLQQLPTRRLLPTTGAP